MDGGLAIAKMDAHKAFDSAQHGAVLASLKYIGCPGWLCSAIVRHHRRGTISFTNGNVPTEKIKRSSSIHQGASTSTLIWRALAHTAIDCAENKWDNIEGAGLEIPGGEGYPPERMMDLRWADDWFIVARTPEALQKMLNVLHGELEDLGLSLCPDKKDKASWMCNRWARKEGQQIAIKGKVVHEREA